MDAQELQASVAFFRTQLESWPLPGLVPVLARLLAAGTFADTGTTVYVFCASDALELPVLLGRPGTAASNCPATSQRIQVRATSQRVLEIDPHTGPPRRAGRAGTMST